MTLTPPPPPSPLTPTDAGIQKVGNHELFMDLIFVFTIAQVTGLIAHPHGLLDYVQAGLVFLSLGWIYDGFVWLTSNRRDLNDLEGWLMFAAMLGFLLMSMAIPTVAGGGGVLFALGLLLVTLIHTLLFARANNSSAQAIFRIAPANFAAALTVLFAAFTPYPWSLLVWALGLTPIILTIILRPESNFSLSPRHFAERHGLLIIIALGETIFGIGTGAISEKLTLPVILYVTLGLVLAAHIWWSYFGPDNARAEHQLVKADPRTRNFMALRGFGYGHFFMLSGIILTAAALEVGVHHPLHPVNTFAAWNMAAGLCVYFLGDVYFHRVMRLGPGRLRLFTAALMLCTAPLGMQFSALAQLIACVVIIVATITLDDYVLEPKRQQAN